MIAVFLLSICEFVKQRNIETIYLKIDFKTVSLAGRFLESKKSVTLKCNRCLKIIVLCVENSGKKNYKVLVEAFGKILKKTKKTVELFIARR